MTDLLDTQLTDRDFENFRKLVYKETGISWTDAKRTLVASRLMKRLRHYGYKSYGEYYDHIINKDPSGEEMVQMINRVTTNKTDFFRENHHFEFLKQTVFPKIKANSKDKKVRIWSAACSSGEEPYSIAMAAIEFFGIHSGWDIRILASDIDSEVLTKAENGTYAAERVADVSPERLERFYQPVQGDFGASFQLKDEVRQLIAFRRINFMESAWPITIQFDAIFCRNVLIYFDEDTKDRVVTRFSDYIKPGGNLFIGHSENITRLTQYFRPLGKTIYDFLQPAGWRNLGNDQKAAQSYAQRNSAALGNAPAAPAVPAPAPQPRPHTAPARQPVAAARTAVATAPAPAPARAASPPAAAPSNLETESIIVGEIAVSAEPKCIKTLVGSCIAVCLHDPVRRIGGMNHFMLPESDAQIAGNPTMGVHAMELLINQIMCLGGCRLQLEAKVFGGGEVVSMGGKNRIGKLNTKFILEFLEQERIPITAQHVGGEYGRRIAFYPHTGKATVECLNRMDFTQPEVAPKPAKKVEMDVELF